MLDIHTHILHGVGDGIESVEGSISLLKKEIENGVSTVVLTPHQYENSNNKDLIIEKYNELLEASKDLNIKILLGAQILFYPNMIDDIKDGKLLTINNSKYVFIEFSSSYDIYIPDVVYELNKCGFKPIVGHIERYKEMKYVEFLEIVANGGSLQINNKTLSSKKISKLIKKLLKEELIDYIGSDSGKIGDCNVDFTISRNLIKKKYKNLYYRLFEKDFTF